MGMSQAFLGNDTASQRCWQNSLEVQPYLYLPGLLERVVAFSFQPPTTSQVDQLLKEMVRTLRVQKLGAFTGDAYLKTL
jgi:hypothetical protein